MAKTYAEKLKDPRWQKKRLEVLNRDNYTCQCCGDDKTELHVHHFSYSGTNPWESEISDLSTTCKHCHAAIESVKKDFSGDFAILGFNKTVYKDSKVTTYQITMVGTNKHGTEILVAYDYVNKISEMTYAIILEKIESLISLTKNPTPYGKAIHG